MKILHTSDWYLDQKMIVNKFMILTFQNYLFETYNNFQKEQSIRTILDNVKNRFIFPLKMVGVISHVETLKERIPLQIKVQPKGNGTSELNFN